MSGVGTAPRAAAPCSLLPSLDVPKKRAAVELPNRDAAGAKAAIFGYPGRLVLLVADLPAGRAMT